MAKIITWIAVNGASVFGITQAVLKCLKEVITALLNLLSIVAPASKVQEVVVKVRAVIEKVDGWVEAAKAKILPSL